VTLFIGFRLRSVKGRQDNGKRPEINKTQRKEHTREKKKRRKKKR